MAILQVKSMPDELYAALGERAKREGISMSEYVIRALRKDLAKPSRQEWVERAGNLYAPDDIRPIDVVALIHEVRAEYDPDERFPAE
jgi:hypothetical protein